MFSEVVERAKVADGAALLAELREIEGAERELEGRRAVVLAELDRCKAYRDDDHASMWGLLRATLHWSDGDCRQAMQIARLVDEHPDVGETLYEHQASVANIGAIALVRANPRVGEHVDEMIGGWLRRAEHTEHDEFNRTVRTWEQRHDAEHARRLTESAHERRTAISGSNEHRGGLAAEWGPVDAVANREILDHYLHAEWLTDWEATVEQYGDEASPVPVPRTDSHRRADALTAALRDAASRNPGAKAPESVVNVHVDHRTFTDLMVEAEAFPERDTTTTWYRSTNDIACAVPTTATRSIRTPSFSSCWRATSDTSSETTGARPSGGAASGACSNVPHVMPCARWPHDVRIPAAGPTQTNTDRRHRRLRTRWSHRSPNGNLRCLRHNLARTRASPSGATGQATGTRTAPTAPKSPERRPPTQRSGSIEVV